MDNFSTTRGYMIHSYQKNGHLKLSFDFSCEIRNFDRKSLNLEIEKIKQIISDIENKIEKL